MHFLHAGQTLNFYNYFCDVTISYNIILATRFLIDVIQGLLESDLFTLLFCMMNMPCFNSRLYTCY